ncbi:S1 RNA-binding domain-containing protein, partial [Kocuria palustris]|uniref:S1 RNA-binding domain-containing protein n=1 Tax=Kocuria palustris TaxID=71999 RepID=UPI0035E0C59C
VGLPTVTDILKELEKPGRDPRPAFRTATFKEGVEKIGDLEPGMVLEGVVTNVAAFGAFVDVGVHQDGLVHVSALSKTFVKDPRDVVKPGDIVKVKVMDVDVQRKRISLSLRLDDEPGAGGGVGQGRGERGSRPPKQRQGQGGQGSGGGQGRQGGGGRDRRGGGGGRQGQAAPAPANSAMADALRRAGLTSDPKQGGGRGR